MRSNGRASNCAQNRSGTGADAIRGRRDAALETQLVVRAGSSAREDLVPQIAWRRRHDVCGATCHRIDELPRGRRGDREESRPVVAEIACGFVWPWRLEQPRTSICAYVQPYSSGPGLAKAAPDTHRGYMLTSRRMASGRTYGYVADKELELLAAVRRFVKTR